MTLVIAKTNQEWYNRNRQQTEITEEQALTLRRGKEITIVDQMDSNKFKISERQSKSLRTRAHLTTSLGTITRNF
jgi:hypothetical protein